MKRSALLVLILILGPALSGVLAAEEQPEPPARFFASNELGLRIRELDPRREEPGDYLLVVMLRGGTEIGRLYEAGVAGSYPEPVALDLSTTNIIVTANSTLSVSSGAAQTVGHLTMKGGSLTTTGAPAGITFADTTVDASAVAIGFDPQVTTDYGVIDANHAAVTISKTGPSNWLLDSQPLNLSTDARFRVEDGSLVLRGEDVIGGRPITVAGGILAHDFADLDRHALGVAGQPVGLDGNARETTAIGLELFMGQGLNAFRQHGDVVDVGRPA